MEALEELASLVQTEMKSSDGVSTVPAWIAERLLRAIVERDEEIARLKDMTKEQG